MARNAAEWEQHPDLPEDHYVNSLIYTAEDIFEEEIQKIFHKTWKFACHESELPESGDFRTINHAGTPIVLVRGDDLEISAFVNACPHRGSLLVTQQRGNAKQFTCFFHLWSFDTKGSCIEITREAGYQKCGLEKQHCGLRKVTVAARLGMVFINLDDSAESFDSNVGDVLRYLEEPMGSRPLEVFHFHQVRLNANWKQWHETNMELYHEWGHTVNRVTAIAAKGYHDRLWEIHPNGHGTIEPMNVSYANYKGWGNRTENLFPGLKPGELRMVDLFPNTTVLVRATGIRIDTSIPIAPGITIVEQRGLGIKGESAEDRVVRQRHHNEIWGPFGRNLAEDSIFVETVSETHRRRASRWGIMARHEGLHAQDDEIMRAYYRVWSGMVGRRASDPYQIDNRQTETQSQGTE